MRSTPHSPIHGLEDNLEDDLLDKRIYATIVVLHVILLYSKQFFVNSMNSMIELESGVNKSGGLFPGGSDPYRIRNEGGAFTEIH